MPDTILSIAFAPVLAALLMKSAIALGAEPEPYGPVPNEAQTAWHDMEIYAFVHFTTNTFTGKEWGFGDEDPQIFNPTDFDVDQIVGTLAKAGFKGVTLTCKHHDGFCLWPTKTTEHNITKSPWQDGKGDMVKEFADAARRHGIRFGVYLSPWDRNSATYGTPAYVDLYHEQLRELLSNYGPLFTVWHDGANGGDGYYGGAREKRSIDNTTYYNWPRHWDLTRKLQPKAVIFSDIGPDIRWIGNEHGIANYPCWATYTPISPDSREPTPGHALTELGMTGTADGKFWIPGECDVSIRPGWFWHEEENDKVRSPANLLDLYFKSVGRGASFLLNVPPDRRGQIHENDVRSLEGFKKALDELYAQNLADGAKVVASSTREGFEASSLLDEDPKSYWCAPDAVTQAEIVLTLSEPRAFDVIKLREAIHLGQRVRKFAVDVREDGSWREWITEGSSIGAHTLLRGPKVTTQEVRLRILESAAPPCLSELSLWLTPTNVPDHTAPVDSQLVLTEPLRATASSEQNTHPATHATDGDSSSIWLSKTGLPQDIIVDLSQAKTISAVTVLPRQDGSSQAVIDRFRLEWSLDGKAWSDPIEDEFPNIRANPISQSIKLPPGTTCRYVRLTALRVIDGNQASLAEVGFLTAE